MNKNKKFRQKWLSFVRELSVKENLQTNELLEMLLQFLRDCGSTLSEVPFNSYSLPELAAIAQDDYPVQFTEFTDAHIPHIRECAATFSQRPDTSIAQFLRSVLKDMLIVENDDDCPNCARGGMGISKNTLDGSLALMCTQCGYANAFDGTKIDARKVIYATTTDLKNAGLIPELTLIKQSRVEMSRNYTQRVRTDKAQKAQTNTIYKI